MQVQSQNIYTICTGVEQGQEQFMAQISKLICSLLLVIIFGKGKLRTKII